MADPIFLEEHRRQLSAMIRQNGCAPERADEAAALACQMANQAAAAFDTARAADQSPDIGIRLMAIEVGAQLAREHFAGIFAQLHAYGQAHNLPTYQGTLDVGKEPAHG